MAITKKTKDLIAKKVSELTPEIDKQKKIVDDLLMKKVHATQYYDDAVAKLNELQSTVADYEKDMKAK